MNIDDLPGTDAYHCIIPPPAISKFQIETTFAPEESIYTYPALGRNSHGRGTYIRAPLRLLWLDSSSQVRLFLFLLRQFLVLCMYTSSFIVSWRFYCDNFVLTVLTFGLAFELSFGIPVWVFLSVVFLLKFRFNKWKSSRNCQSFSTRTYQYIYIEFFVLSLFLSSKFHVCLTWNMQDTTIMLLYFIKREINFSSTKCRFFVAFGSMAIPA